MNSRNMQVARLMRPVWWSLGHLFKRSQIAPRPKTVLIFDFHLIGDIVWLTPLLRAVREGYPEARIVLVAGAWAQDILKGTSWIDEIVSFSAPWVKYGQGWRGWWRCLALVKQLRRRSWDLGIEIRGDVRQILMLALSGARRRVGYDLTSGGALLTDVVPTPASAASGLNHVAAHYHRRICEYLGLWQGQDYMPELTLTEAERTEAREYPEFVGIHFGASLPLRRPPQALMVGFIEELIKLYSGPLVIYRLREAPAVSDLLAGHLTTKFGIHATVWEGSLRQFIVHLSRCKKLYCLDSGPGHIAAALGVEVTVIYGPSLPHVTRPLGTKVNIVDGRMPECRPCDQRHCVSKNHQECFAPAAKWV